MTPADFDDVLADSLDELPAWVLDQLSEVVVRVEMRRPDTFPWDELPTFSGRLVLYREPTLEQARNRRELRRLVKSELLRAVVVHLDLDGRHAADLATALI
jgi:predicted Zn-dependent protease with MMP-like domain